MDPEAIEPIAAGLSDLETAPNRATPTPQPQRKRASDIKGKAESRGRKRNLGAHHIPIAKVAHQTRPIANQEELRLDSADAMIRAMIRAPVCPPNIGGELQSFYAGPAREDP